MEIKINKEIREYTENMFFGLSFRQFFFSLFAALGYNCLRFIKKQIRYRNYILALHFDCSSTNSFWLY